MSEVKIEENENVFAEYLSNGTILIHPELKSKPELYNHILNHEYAHAQSNQLMDFFHDFRELFAFKRQWEITKFFLFHPKLIINGVLPYTSHNNVRYWDYFQLTWMVIFLSLGIIIGGFAI